MRASVVWAVMRTTFREHWRTPEALFWTYGFPVLMAVALGLAFGERDPAPVEVAVLASGDAVAVQELLSASDRLHVEVMEAAVADRRMVMGELDALVSGTADEPLVRIDPTRDNGELVRILVSDAFQRSAGVEDAVSVALEKETRPGSRYIDFLIPGLIGMNLLGAGMWGVGFQLVVMRSKHLLRRLLVAPVGRGEFLLGFLLSRVVLMVPESFLIALFGMLFFDVPVRGSWFVMGLLIFVGALAFTGLGVLVSSRAKTIEGVSGLMNFVMLPMWLLGGSFFSNTRFPDFMQPLVQALPLTQVNHGLRDVMLGGASLGDVWLPLAVLGGTGVVSLGAAVRIFRWL